MRDEPDVLTSSGIDYVTTTILVYSDFADIAVDFLARHPAITEVLVMELVGADNRGRPCDQLDITMVEDLTAERRLCRILSLLCQRYGVLFPTECLSELMPLSHDST